MRSFFSFLFFFVFLVSLAVGAWFAAYAFTPAPGLEERTVHIPKGAGVRRVQALLGQEGIISDDIRFLALTRIFQIIGQSPRLRAGEFKVPLGLTPLEVIRFLDTAQPVRHRVTVPERKRKTEVAAIFAEDDWVDTEAFLRLCQDRG
ncbi:MAG: hypothetical protein D3909_18555, partial [Candidatus Electrothrix sp. ATG1]|nr:hypothetical protein [Candidatus Electrothrix sp. ATG1]